MADNGSGCADPQVLLTVAHSGWTASVSDPAGMGILSTLNPEISRSVTFRSQDWMFTLTPDAFARGEAARVVPQAHRPSSFEVQLHLARALDVPALLRVARARVPLTVTLNGDLIPMTDLPGERVSLTCGELILHDHPHTYRDPQRTLAYWEGFPLSAAPLRQALMTRLTTPAQVYLDAHSLILLPLVESGLRPKLPDRTLLLDNFALDTAADEIAVIIRTRMAPLTAGIDLTQDVLEDHAVHTGGDTLAARVRTAWLMHHGYVRQSRLDPETVTAEFGHDGEDDDITGLVPVWVRQAGRVAGTIGECASVDALGLPVRVVNVYQNAPQETLRVHAGPPLPSSAPNTTFYPEVRVVPTLTVQDQDVPWFVTGAALFLRGRPDEAEATLRAHTGTIGACFLAEVWDEGDRYELSDLTDRPGEITAQAFGEAALSALIQAHFPQRRQAQAEVDGALRAAEAAGDAVKALRRLRADLAPPGIPEVVVQLVTLEEAQRARAATLREHHRLA